MNFSMLGVTDFDSWEFLKKGGEATVDAVGWLSNGENDKFDHFSTYVETTPIITNGDIFEKKVESIEASVSSGIKTGVKDIEYGAVIAGVLGLILVGSYVYSNVKK
jgi:hypothetical protein